MLSSTIVSELDDFKMNGYRGKFLEFAYQKMLNIKASSCDVERLFSSSVQVVNRLRTSLNDDTIDNIMFLKNYRK